jgi:multisubunit Na+/H+ antiporter MnhC subunit
MVRLLVAAAVLFAGAGILAVTTSSTWPLLLVRVVLIALGVALLILALGRRQRKVG